MYVCMICRKESHKDKHNLFPEFSLFFPHYPSGLGSGVNST